MDLRILLHTFYDINHLN